MQKVFHNFSANTILLSEKFFIIHLETTDATMNLNGNLHCYIYRYLKITFAVIININDFTNSF